MDNVEPKVTTTTTTDTTSAETTTTTTVTTPAETTTITEPTFRLGDVNLDGNVNVQDVVLLQKYLIQKATLTKAQGTAANYQKDAVIDVLDLLALKRDVWKNL